MKKMFAIFDSKISSFIEAPMMMISNGQAIRGWETACNDPKSDFYKHPEDFTLFELGTYDESSGKFDSLPTPVSLGLASQYKKPPETSTPLEDMINAKKRGA